MRQFLRTIGPVGGIFLIAMAANGLISAAWGEEPSANQTPKAPWPWIDKELVLAIETGPDNPRNSEGDFLALDNGDILYIYTHYYGTSGDDHATAYLASRRSSDGGKTWSAEDKIEIENEGKLNVMSVTCRRLADGRAALLYLVKENPADCRPYLRFLNADGTWGERSCCIDQPSYNVVNNDRMIELASGRLLIPVARHAYKGPNQYDLDWNADTFCLISDDGGTTWRKAGEVKKIENVVYQEPGLCELADGRILMNIRTGSGAQFFAYSDDSGETWSEAAPSCLDSPMSPTLIKRLPASDELLAVGNPLLQSAAGGGSRSAMTIERLSPDGQTVLTRKTLEHPERLMDDWQYPAIHFVGDGSILVGYFSWGRGVRVYRMNLADL